MIRMWHHPDRNNMEPMALSRWLIQDCMLLASSGFNSSNYTVQASVEHCGSTVGSLWAWKCVHDYRNNVLWEGSIIIFLACKQDNWCHCTINTEVILITMTLYAEKQHHASRMQSQTSYSSVSSGWESKNGSTEKTSLVHHSKTVYFKQFG